MTTISAPMQPQNNYKKKVIMEKVYFVKSDLLDKQKQVIAGELGGSGSRVEIRETEEPKITARIGKKDISFSLRIDSRTRIQLGKLKEDDIWTAADFREMRKTAVFLKEENQASRIVKKNTPIALMTLRQYMDVYFFGSGYRNPTDELYKKVLRNCDILLEKNFSKMTEGDILDWAQVMRSKKRNLKETTIKNTYGGVRAVYEYAKKKNHILLNPVSKIAFEDDSDPDRVIYTKKEIKRILKAISERPDPKHRLFFVLLMTTGCRPGELISAKKENIDFKKRILIIEKEYSKTKKTREISFNKIAKKMLKNYINDVFIENTEINPDGFLFFNTDTKKPFGAFRTPWYTIKKYAGLKKGTKYDMRHTFASKMIKHADIQTISDLLGHADIKTTQIYIRSLQKRKSKAIQKAEDVYRIKEHFAGD